MIITPPKGCKVVCGRALRARRSLTFNAPAAALQQQIGVPFQIRVPGDAFGPIPVRDFAQSGKIIPGTGALTCVDERQA